jgi:RimJ/RimL family protein N-acetyltransferase
MEAHVQVGDVRLRELTEADLPLLAGYANNPKVSRNLRDAFPSPYTLEDARTFKRMTDAQDPKTAFAIEYRGAYAGNISLTPGMDVYRRGAEIGYFVGEPFWNKGIATRAVRLMVARGFESLGLVRIHTGVFSYNTASMRVLEKCGFALEGIARLAVEKNGALWDEYRYAILKT